MKKLNNKASATELMLSVSLEEYIVYITKHIK